MPSLYKASTPVPLGWRFLVKAVFQDSCLGEVSQRHELCRSSTLRPVEANRTGSSFTAATRLVRPKSNTGNQALHMNFVSDPLTKRDKLRDQMLLKKFTSNYSTIEVQRSVSGWHSRYPDALARDLFVTTSGSSVSAPRPRVTARFERLLPASCANSLGNLR